MDDTKTIDAASFPVTIGGVEYRFDRPDPKLIEKMLLISNMNADRFVTLQACTKWFSVAAGREQWSDLMGRFLNDDIQVQDFLTAIQDLAAAMVADVVAQELSADGS